MTAVDHVYRVHSTVEVPYETLEQYLETAELPAAIERLETTRQGNQVFIESVPTDDSVGKYTPTATLRATVDDTRIYEYEGARSRTRPATPDEESVDSTVETFAHFKGRLGTVLKNTALRAPMFAVLRDIAHLADRGDLTAIVAEDGALRAVAVRDGEEVSASVEVTESNAGQAAVDSLDWQNSSP